MEYKYPAGAGAGGNADTAKSLVVTVRNNTGSLIPKRTPVYVSGALGNRPTIALASNTSESTSSKVLGFTIDDIAHNTDGEVISFGRLEKVNTSAFTSGQALWLGATAGTVTTTKPQAPNHMVFLGIVVIANPANGVIEVQVQNGFELDELHNVKITSPANNQTLVYDSTTSLWKNTLLPAGTLAPSAPDANKALVRDASGNVVSAPIANVNIDANADIALSKLASLAANKIAVTDGSGKLAANSGTVTDNEVVAYNAGTLYTVTGVTNTKVGYLTNVTSDIQSQINGKLDSTLKGAANGLAELDGSGKVPSSQLPSYVDDVLEYANLAAFPVTGVDGIIYIALDTNLCYRWGGSTYVEISPSLALGETSTTAYRGDRGKAAYDHSQTTGNPHSTAIGDISGLQTALDGKFDDPTGTALQYLAGDGSVQNFPLYYQANRVVVEVVNTSTSTMAKGVPVYIQSISSNKPGVRLAGSVSATHNEKLLGLTADSIAAGAAGLVVVFGLLEGFNTDQFLPSQAIWLSNTAGQLTYLEPEAPNYKSLLGFCITQDISAGKAFVSIRPGKDLTVIKDILVSGPTDGQILQYEAATSLWKNKVLAVSTTERTITQASHGFSVGNILYLNGSTYALAKADSSTTLNAVGIVKEVVDANTFKLALSGYVSGLTGVSAGTQYYLSTSSAGQFTSVVPSTLNHYVKPIAIGVSSTEVFVSIQRESQNGSNRLTTSPLATTLNPAIANTHYLANTSSAAFTVTLPAGAANSVIRFSDANETWDTNNLTITPASGEKIDNLATNESLVCDVKRGWVELSWNTALSSWSLQSLAATDIASASATQAGIVTTGAQTFAGVKTFQDGLAFTSASLSHAQATIMGLKQYVHGTTYNGGIAPTVTCSVAGATIQYGEFIPYQMQDGTWKLRFNVYASWSSQLVASATFAINGVTFAAGANRPAYGFLGGTSTYSRQFVQPATNTMNFDGGTANSTAWYIGGDITIASKPTWAY